MNIHEIISYGPAVFSDEETGVIITVNGSYFNWWTRSRSGWDNVDCRPTGEPDGLYKLTTAEAMKRAEAWFKESSEQPELNCHGEHFD